MGPGNEADRHLVNVRVPIDELLVGMFVEAGVKTLYREGEMRHFLEPTDATYLEPTSKRLRLMKKKIELVTTSGGMLLGSRKQIAALKQISISEVVVNTDKSDILPGSQTASAEPDPPPKGKAETEAPRRPSPPQRVDIAGTERRRNFGPSNSGWMKLEVTETDDEGAARLCAFLQVISFGGDARMGADDVFQVLEEQYGICAGLDDEMVRKLAEQAAASPNRVIRGRFLVASSPPPDPDKVGRIDFVCLRDMPPDSELPFSRLRQAFAADQAADAADDKVQVCVVTPGQELAVFDASGGGDSPPDIFGSRLPPLGLEALLRNGNHVELDGERFVSRIFGYVCIHDGEISVIPPVWVSPDHMEAYYIHLLESRSERPVPTRDWLDQILQAQAVTHGLDESTIDELLTLPPEKTEAFLLAAGSRPEPGGDAVVSYTFGGKDGVPSTDMVTRHDESLVKEGDMIAEVTAAFDGKAGVDLSGMEVEGGKGKEQFLLPGTNVRCEDHEGRQCFFAEIEGSARSIERTVRVQPVVYVQGHVNRPMKVKPGSDVYVRGSVRAGGTIETDGDIAVEGSVEGGAVIQSQENVVIEKGIIGHGTRVVAQGSVSARFVHGSTVITAGDVTSTHLMNATVRARNLVVNDVEGDAKAGSIVGGQTLATGKVEASRAGSPTSEQTRIAIINDPELQAQMTKLDKGLEFCRTNILRILRTLGVREIDAVKLKELIDKAPPEKRKPLIKILTQLKQLVDTRDKSTKRRQTLAEEQEELFAEAEICIRGLVHADVQVQIGERAFSPKDDITVGAVFERTAKGISWSPPETE